MPPRTKVSPEDKERLRQEREAAEVRHQAEMARVTDEINAARAAAYERACTAFAGHSAFRYATCYGGDRRKLARALSERFQSVRVLVAFDNGNESLSFELKAPEVFGPHSWRSWNEDSFRKLGTDADSHWPTPAEVDAFATAFMKGAESRSEEVDQLKRELREAKQEQDGSFGPTGRRMRMMPPWMWPGFFGG